MLKSLRKRFAVRSYVKRLAPDLKRRYGKQKLYSPAQVKRTVESGGYNVDYLCYALCMYCSPRDFAEYHRATGEVCDYAAMRCEVANKYFSGDASFDPMDASHGASWWHGDAIDSDSDGGGDVGDTGGDSGGGGE